MKYNLKYANQQLQYVENGESKSLEANKIIKTEVIIQVVRKNLKDEVLNSAVNFLTSSIGNGNENVLIGLDVTTQEDKMRIYYDNRAYVRNNLDYHEAVKKVRSIQDKIRKSA